jgi:TPR repeat protein
MRLALTIAVLLCVFCSLARAQQAPQEPGRERVADYIAKAHDAEKRLDFNDAVNWYEKAAELGDAGAMHELGWIFFGAHDISGRRFQDYSKAAVWFQKAAGLNYVPALTQLGNMYNHGSFGLPEDHEKAAQLYLRAAQAGNARAMNNLGVMYSRGRGVPRDLGQATFWWRKAVDADKDGPNGIAAQSWLDLLDGKPLFSR